MSTPTIAIIGLPNVGKSSLFNKICGRRFAVVHDSPGVTRDYKITKTDFLGLKFDLIDTAGWTNQKDELSLSMRHQTNKAIEFADIILLVIDAKQQISAAEKELAHLLKMTKKKHFLLINKAEGNVVQEMDLNEVYSLQLGDPIYISATTKLGFTELYENLEQTLKDFKKLHTPAPTEESTVLDTINVAIVGKPNSGKSTLFNKLLKYERVIVSKIAGTTRDTISSNLKHDKYTIHLIDTAGMRKVAKIEDQVEEFAVAETITAIRRAHIVLLMIDAQLGLQSQDMKIAGIAYNEGKALLVILNKMDLIRNRKQFMQDTINALNQQINDIKGFKILYKSMLKERSGDDILNDIIETFEHWRTQINTAKLNRWLAMAQEKHLPPLAHNGRRIKLKYITQIAVRPPTFKIFCNYFSQLPQSYIQYLKKSLIENCNLKGASVRIELSKSKNPYVKENN